MYHTSKLHENDEFNPNGIVTELFGVVPVGSSGKVTGVTRVSKNEEEDILSLHLLIPKAHFESQGLPVPETESDTESMDESGEGKVTLQHGRVPVNLELPRSDVEIVLIEKELTPVAGWNRSQRP